VEEGEEISWDFMDEISKLEARATGVAVVEPICILPWLL
jgi:hypothetical protein